MLELSLHILDLLENATRAGATVVYVGIVEDAARNRLEIQVEDNGPGLSAAPEQALDPFYTTKKGKKTGLGLSFFRAAAEQAGGSLNVGESELGGVAVHVCMQLNHVDRAPLGDLAETFRSLVLTHPEIDFCCHVQCAGGETLVRTSEVLAELGPDGASEFAVARAVAERIHAAVTPLRA